MSKVINKGLFSTLSTFVNQNIIPVNIQQIKVPYEESICKEEIHNYNLTDTNHPHHLMTGKLCYHC